MEIKVYGTGTSGYQLVLSTLKHFLSKASIPSNIIQITDVGDFLERKIQAVPAVEINNEQAISLKSNGSFNHSLREIVKNVLKRGNYGKLGRIIVPIDFSENSTNAFFFAQKMASEFDAIVDVVHVYMPNSFEIPSLHTVDVQVVAIENELNKFVEKYDSDWGTDVLKNALVEGHCEIGFPSDRIINLSKKLGAGMIVMGVGNNDLLQKIIGSTTRSVIKASSVPVMILPREIKYKPFKTVVLAIANESDLKPCMDAIAEIKKLFNPKIFVVHHGHEIIDTFGYEDVSLILLEEGKPMESVIQFADDVHADLLVVKKKQRPLMESLFHKSFAKNVAQTSSIPVLVIK